MSNVMKVREVAPDDLPQWEALWESHNTFYQRTVPPEVTRMTGSRFFDVYDLVHALIAEKEGPLSGLVH